LTIKGKNWTEATREQRTEEDRWNFNKDRRRQRAIDYSYST